jgi:alkaline phosphatase
MKVLFCAILLFAIPPAFSQPIQYTTANAHSHNDYEQSNPFWAAYNAGFGSIEADIFLHENELLVAHEAKELVKERSLEKLYLKPLQLCLAKHNNFIYKDTSRRLQLLVDIKTDSIATLNKLIAVLSNYPALTNNPSLRFVITGGRPTADKFSSYPAFIFFDGNLGTIYNEAALGKIAMFSSSFQNYSDWKGIGTLPATAKHMLTAEIEKAHALHKPVRLWAAPDAANAWRQLMGLKVDYINTDHITALSSFLEKHGNESEVRTYEKRIN